MIYFLPAHSSFARYQMFAFLFRKGIWKNMSKVLDKKQFSVLTDIIMKNGAG